jgi:two-component system phosphate regulon response regulator PhoB
MILAESADRRARVSALLVHDGYQSQAFTRARDALTAMSTQIPDALIAWIDDCSLDGISLVALLRASPRTRCLPIIVAAAEEDGWLRRATMDDGADAFLVEPIAGPDLLEVLTARLRNSRERPRSISARRSSEESIAIGNWSWNPARRLLLAGDGTERQLTLSEARLLSTFLEAPGVVLDRDQLSNGMGRAGASPFDRSIDVFVGQLRKKLTSSDLPTPIRTIRSSGYALDCPVYRAG